MKSRILGMRRALIKSGVGVASSFAPRVAGHLVARQFVTPLSSGRSKAAHAVSDFRNARIDHMEVAGHRVATYIWGDVATQPFVLLGHGWSSYALRFGPWIERLRYAGFSVLGFDQPAHGLSDGKFSTLPIFVAVTREMGRRFGQPAAFIGHSLGAIAALFAVEPAWCPLRFGMIAPLAFPREGALRLFDNLGVSEKAFIFFERWLENYTNEEFDSYRADHVLPKMRAPALVIHDRYDRQTPWEEGRLYADLWPGAKFYCTERFGHDRLLDNNLVIDRMVEFIKGEVGA